MKKLIIAISAFALMTISCNKSKIIQPTEPETLNNIPAISSKNGILIIKDFNTLNSLEEKMNTMTFEDRLKWEKSLNFESQFSIFEKIAIKEYDLQIKPYETKSDLELKNIPFPGHCAEYNQAIKDGIIEEKNEDGTYIDYSLTDKSMAKYLNKDGFILVGSTLIQAKKNILKKMTDATVEDINTLNTTKTSSSKITIENLAKKTRGSYSANQATGWQTSGKYRVSLSTTFSIVALNGMPDPIAQTMQGFPLKLYTNSQKKNTWGNWNQYWGQQYISGNAYLGLKWSQNALFNNAPTPYDKLNNFSTANYLASGSNATFTWHPFTGQTNTVAINTMSYATITAPLNGWYSFWPEIKPINYNISASLPGGCCGLSISISH
ncbi:MAG: hypothetical protein KA275_02655 [Chitinophagaceae bacterium]|nr:hypothetical protein [Chitinophagaceae bacterium]